VEDNWKNWLRVSVLANSLIGVTYLVMMYVNVQAETDSSIQFWFDYYILHPITTFPIATILLLFYTVLAVILFMFGFAFFFEGSILKFVFSIIAAIPSVIVCYYQIADHILMFYDSLTAPL